MARKSINTTIDEAVYSQIQILALILSKENKKKINANDLIEEGMKEIIEKNKEKISELNI